MEVWRWVVYNTHSNFCYIKIYTFVARNTTGGEGGGRKLNENKALTSGKNRFNPYTAKFEGCRICKQKVHQAGSYYCKWQQ